SPIAECRVKPCPIIAQLDVPHNVLPCFLPGRVNGTVDPLDFQGCIERFRQGIVKADPSPADGLADPEPLQDSRELSRSVIAAAVGMKDRISRDTGVAGRHLDRLYDHWGAVIII